VRLRRLPAVFDAAWAHVEVPQPGLLMVVARPFVPDRVRCLLHLYPAPRSGVGREGGGTGGGGDGGGEGGVASSLPSTAPCHHPNHEGAGATLPSGEGCAPIELRQGHLLQGLLTLRAAGPLLSSGAQEGSGSRRGAAGDGSRGGGGQGGLERSARCLFASPE